MTKYKYKCNTSLFSRNITKNKVYDLVKSDRKIITIINDHGKEDDYHESYFYIVEEPVIEVGSEWIAALSKQGEKTLVVLHVGQQMSLCKWIADNREFSIKNTEFNTTYKPKPKAVTMYFYKDSEGVLSASECDPIYSKVLFTKEIEL